MASALGIIGIVVFIAAIISLAMAVTWVVVRVSPTPKSSKER